MHPDNPQQPPPFRPILSGEQPSYQESPVGQPPKKKPSKWVWAAAIVALLLAFGAIVGSDDEDDAGAEGTATPTEQVVDDETEAAEPEPEPEPEPTFLDAEKHKGTGDDVVSTEWPDQVGIVTFKCPKCSGNTVLQSDGGESLLVNTIGPYRGTRWINMHDGSLTTTFTINATGAWTLTIADLDTVERVDGKASGSGDDVVYLDADSTKAAVSNRGQGNFVVQVLSGSGIELAVNEIGSYQGTVPLRGPALVEMTSEGDWAIDPS